MTDVTMATNEPVSDLVESTERPYGVFAEFTSTAKIYEAAKAVHAAGYRWWDCLVPFPVHGLDKAMGIKPTILPIIVFFAGLTGTLVAVFLQVYTNSLELPLWLLVPVSGYQFEVSGKPLISAPAFVPVAFEMTILFACLTAVGAMFVMNGLPCLYHPVFRHPRLMRLSDDRFFVVIETRDPKYVRGETEAFLETLDPEVIDWLEA
jgi:hypothetical protein